VGVDGSLNRMCEEIWWNCEDEVLEDLLEL